MPKRKDQKDTLTNLAGLQNDPGRARGEDFEVQNANPERDKYAAKDKGEIGTYRKSRASSESCSPTKVGCATSEDLLPTIKENNKVPDRDPTPAEEILERIRPSLSPRRVINPEPVPAVSPRSTPLSRPSSYKKGSAVRKTGLAQLHKGELVLTKKKGQALKVKLQKKKKPAKKQLAKRTITTQA